MAHEKFHYTTEAGEEIVLPRFKNLPTSIIRKIRKLSDVDQIFTVLESFDDEELLAKVDAMQSEEFNGFIVAWQKDSKVTAGESKASSGS